MVLCFSLRHKFYTEFRHTNEIAESQSTTLGSKCVSFSDDDEIARIIFLHNRACKHLLL